MSPNDFLFFVSPAIGIGAIGGSSAAGAGGCSKATSPMTSIIMSVAGSGADGAVV